MPEIVSAGLPLTSAAVAMVVASAKAMFSEMAKPVTPESTVMPLRPLLPLVNVRLFPSSVKLFPLNSMD